MSIEADIYNAVKDAIQDGVKGYPQFAKKSTMAKILDVSTDKVDEMVRLRILIEEIHFTRFTEGGNVMFFVAEVLSKLRPRLAKEKILV